MVAFFRRLRARVKYWNHERDLKRELELHQEMAARDIRGRSESEADARARARRLLGNDTIAREDARAVWVARWIEQGLQDVRHGIRALRRQPTFAVTAIGTLALGLGLSASLVTVFNAAFLRPWPIGHPGRVLIVTSSLGTDLARSGRIRVGQTSVDGLPLAAVRDIATRSARADYAYVGSRTPRLALTMGDRRRFVPTAFVSDNFLEVAELGMQVGRGFQREDTHGSPRAVITDRLWRGAFAADPAVSGRQMALGGVEVTIVGVLPRAFTGLTPNEFDVLVPISAGGAWPEVFEARDLVSTAPWACCADLFGRLKPGQSADAARSELRALFADFTASRDLPPATVHTTGTSALARRGLDPQSAQLFALLASGCGLVLLLSCFNVGHLELARGCQRRRELATRLALGASRGRVVRQLVTEGALVALVSGALAFGISLALPSWLMSRLGPTPGVTYIPDPVVAFSVGVLACAAGILFSLVPALQGTRIRLTGSVLPQSSGFRTAVLAIQLALSAVVVVGAALLGRSVNGALDGHLDFAVRNVAMVTVTPPQGAADLSDHLQLRALWARLSAAMAADRVPFSPITQPPISKRRTSAVAIAGDGRSHDVQVQAMAPSGLERLGVPLMVGRLYSEDLARHEALVNEQLAAALWPDQSPIGQVLHLDSYDRDAYTVVGVTRNAHLTSLGALQSLVQVPLPRSVPIALSAMIPTTPSAEADVRKVISRVDARLAVDVHPLTADIRSAMADQITGAMLAAALAAIALTLSVVGVFSVFMSILEERRHDIGVRLALGADRVHIVSTVFVTTGRPILVGACGGLFISLVAGATLQSYLVGVPRTDVISYVLATAALTATVAIASTIPLRRALRIDPAVTLRQD